MGRLKVNVKYAGYFTLKMKTIIVTGGNKGIGLGIVKKLLRDYEDTFLLLGSRDAKRGEEAVKEVVQELGGNSKNRIQLLVLDVCNDSSIAEAVEKVKLEHNELFGLINNAGGSLSTARETVELNTYAPIKVTEAFLPLLKKDGGRVVQISSASGPSFVSKCIKSFQDMLVNPNVTFNEVEQKLILPYLNITDKNLPAEEQKKSIEAFGANDSAYGLSKACLNAYSIELAKKYPNLLINSCTPGFIETDLTKGFAQRSGKSPAEMGMKSPDAGAKAAVYLMMADLRSEIADYESGRYYGSDAVRSPLHKYRSPGDAPYDGSYP